MLLYVAAGIGCGIITGLVPGVHVNLVATLALAAGAGSESAPFLVALSITHTFLDAIPGVLLGAPDADTAMGVLPGHRYVLRGWGYMAVKLTLVGAYFGLLAALVLVPVWWQAIKLYPLLPKYLGWMLLTVSAYMILRDKKRWWALAVYLSSGALGWILLNKAVLADPLFPLFSGLFGVATLLYSLSEKSCVPPQQIMGDIQMRWRDAFKAIGAGNVSGFLSSMLPGLGAAQAAVLGMNISGKIGDHGFLVMIGTIGTVNFALSLLTWLALDKARNGAVVAMQQVVTVSHDLVVQLMLVALIAGSLSVPLAIMFSRIAVRVVTRIPYAALSVSIIVLLIALVGLLTGWRGLLVLVTATGLGLVPAVVKCGRAHAMGCLMLPVAFYFL